MNIETVTREDVAAAYAVKKTTALKRVLDKMDSLDQGKIEKDVFDRANAIIECKCGNGNVVSAEEALCKDCERKIREEEKEKKVRLQFETLLEELNSLGNFKYVFKENNKISNGLNCTIYEGCYYTGGTWSSRSKPCLRIETTDYGIHADKLRKWFGGTKLAEGLDKKCKELEKKIELKSEAKEVKVNNIEAARKQVRKDFGEIEKIEYVYYSGGAYNRYRGRTSTTEVEFTYKERKIHYSISSNTYALPGHVMKATSKQIKAVINVLEDSKSKIAKIMKKED